MFRQQMMEMIWIRKWKTNGSGTAKESKWLRKSQRRKSMGNSKSPVRGLRATLVVAKELVCVCVSGARSSGQTDGLNSLDSKSKVKVVSLQVSAMELAPSDGNSWTPDLPWTSKSTTP